MDYFFHAVVIGLLLSLMIGPVFFVLLEISITKGFKAAMIFDAGVLLSDIFYVFLSLFFAYQLRGLGSLKNNFLLSIIGGGLFLVYGIYNLWFKKITLESAHTLEQDLSEEQEIQTDLKKKQRKIYALLFLKGFTLNLLNPGVVIYWLAIIAKGFDLVDSYEGKWHIYFFVLIILGVFFGVDSLKAYLANKLKPLVTIKLLKSLNILIGGAFMGTGIFLILRQILKV